MTVCSGAPCAQLASHSTIVRAGKAASPLPSWSLRSSAGTKHWEVTLKSGRRQVCGAFLGLTAVLIWLAAQPIGAQADGCAEHPDLASLRDGVGANVVGDCSDDISEDPNGDIRLRTAHGELVLRAA